MKFIKLFTLLFLSTFGFAQTKPINVKVSGNIFNLNGDSIKLAQFYGTFYKDFASTKLDKTGNFSIETQLPAKDYYVLRVGDKHINLILDENSDVKIYGDGKQIQKYCNIIGSDATQNMNLFIREMEVWNARRDSGTRVIQQNPALQQEVNNSLSRDYYYFDNIRKNFIASNINSPALLPALSSYDPQREWETYEGIVKQLQTGFGGSPTIMQVTQIYEQEKVKIEAGMTLAPGKIAPDFEETKLDGTTMKLSDLKGKVVLLDFWASWCGPCRKENPNVVNLYNQYKDKGFTVMSVSLDSSRERWEAAIAQDNLTWPNHVSDLQKWSSKVAKLYNVGSIPFTVLIDQEGKIIQTNLRGEALEAELARIFGE